MPVPEQPKIYHIVHVDKLPSIITDGYLWSDSEIEKRTPPGTTIGMRGIKHRRLHELALASHPGLYVGECVPFYFCPRSVMLYLLYQGNHPELDYHGGQDPIIHLETNLHDAIAWAESEHKRWAFTLSNAGTRFFEDRCDLEQLGDIDWDAVKARKWSGNGIPSSVKEGKQAEFLIEERFPWHLIKRIGVHSESIYRKVSHALSSSSHRTRIEVKEKWYY